MGQRNTMGIDEAAFRSLDRQYRANEGGDLLVQAFNTLRADDRAIMLAYLTIGKNKKALARLLGVSWQLLDERLWKIQVVVKERYEKLIKDTEQ